MTIEKPVTEEEMEEALTELCFACDSRHPFGSLKAITHCHTVFNYISQLKKRIEELEVEKWISVEDQKPKLHEGCLIVDGGSVSVGKYHELYWWDGLVDDQAIAVTHWQPLPDPPSNNRKIK